jgi:chorismate mutase
MVRGIRGATTVMKDTPEAVKQATKALVAQMINDNNVEIENLASVMFSVTSDICSEFPAVAVRELGWNDVPLLNFQEMDKQNALKMCIRVLMHWNTGQSQASINHVYLEGAKVLRPDLLK